MHQQQTTFENILGKGKLARNKQFLLFPQCFLLPLITASPFAHIFDIVSLFAAELEEPKIGISGKGFMTLRRKKSHSSVGSVVDLTTDGLRIDPRLGQYSFRGLMRVIATGFIPFSPLFVVSTMVK